MMKKDDEFEVEHGTIKSACFPFSASKYNGNMNNGGVVVLTTTVIKITFFILNINYSIIYYFLLIFILFICAYNDWVISPLFPTGPSLSLFTPSLPGRNYLALISNFVEERV
jgi:hypothetical protein